MDRKDGVLLRVYELGQLLGQGSFAKVYYARNLKTGTGVAVKVIQKEKILKAGLIDQMKREISIMRLVKHPNVVELYEVLASKSKIYLVMEYAKGGELFDLVAKGKLKEDVARKYFQQLIWAVGYCHRRGVCHRDLKLENLMLGECGNLKVADFGFSAVAEGNHRDGLLHTTCGTPGYVAPEVISKGGYDGAKADVWSCGVVLYVLLTGYLPFRDLNLMEMYRKIEKAEYKLPAWFPQDVRNLLARILDPNPNSRISAEQIEECPWFQKDLTSTSRNVGICLQFENFALESEIRRNVTDDDDLVIRPRKMNAFEIISFSSGLDLSGFFEENKSTKALRFTYTKDASSIFEKLHDFADKADMRMEINDKGVIEMKGKKDGKKEVMCIDAEIFEIATSVHLVELKIANHDDTFDYPTAARRDIKLVLKDIVWKCKSICTGSNFVLKMEQLLEQVRRERNERDGL